MSLLHAFLLLGLVAMAGWGVFYPIRRNQQRELDAAAQVLMPGWRALNERTLAAQLGQVPLRRVRRDDGLRHWAFYNALLDCWMPFVQPQWDAYHRQVYAALQDPEQGWIARLDAPSPPRRPRWWLRLYPTQT